MRRLFYAGGIVFFLTATSLLLVGVFSEAAQSSGQASDLAFGRGLVRHGQHIPLPSYPDGAPASPEECIWMTSIHAVGLHNGVSELHSSASSDLLVTMEGVDWETKAGITNGWANYMIVCSRTASVAVDHTTWGALKQRH